MAPIGWRLSPAEWAFVVNDTRTKIVFTGPGFDGVPQQLAGRLDHGPRIVGADAARAMIDAAARIAFAPSGRDDAVLQLYTSGTTGNPDRQSVMSGKSETVRVDLGGRRQLKKK